MQKSVFFAFSVLICMFAARSFGQSPATPSAVASASPASSEPDRYGPFGLFDHRSKYGENWFAEPLFGDEFDAEQELRLSWTRTGRHADHADDLSTEIEKSWGLFTLEIEGHYSHESVVEDGARDNTDGIGPLELSLRHPFYQYVSDDEFYDLTLGARTEFAFATGSDASKNTEVVGGIFQELGLGKSFNLQFAEQLSRLFGPGEDGDKVGGALTFEYVGVFSYNIDLDSHPLALTRIQPQFEINGETALNHGESGTTELLGVAGAIFTFDSINVGQPKISAGYIFPLNDDARDDLHWGFSLNFILEY